MSGNRKLENTGIPKLFSPAVTRENLRFSVPREVNLGSLDDTNFESTSSFRYEEAGLGLRSTQEVPLDWSVFENHTFFNSARSKVNVAFDKIINEYPFDGSRKQVEAFEDSLTGYEKHILDIFPKNTGFLMLSGTSVTENPAGGFDEKLGTWIKVIDSAGAQFPDFSTNSSAEPVLDFSTNPFSIEFLFRLPEDATSDYQVLMQKQSGSEKTVTLALDSQPSTTNTIDLLFFITSGSARIFTSASLEKGKFSHVCATYDRNSTGKLFLYVSESLVSTSSTGYEFDSLSFERAPMFIGSGSAFTITRNSDVGGTTFTPAQTLSGAIDELRVWHSVRNPEDQKKYAAKPVYPENDLKMYFKFNEPSGSFNIENIVLDSSGNSLHSRIENFSTNLRATGSYANPVYYENIERSPVLFPSFRKISSLNTTLLASADTYDRKNPNLVTKLVPVHYLLEGQASQGFKDQDGQIGDIVTANSIPGSAKMGSVQNITAFLLIWAKFFDEIKVFIDHFGEILHPSYDNDKTVASKLLPFVSNYYGLSLPAIFPNTDPTQYIDGENIEDSYSTAVRSLSFIQSEIWKRILINLNEITRSKGTVHAIKSIIRAAGINPDNLLTIREYGGPTKRSLKGLRESKIEVASMLDFSGSINTTPGDLDGAGFSSKVPHIVSPFLSSSRVERGYPAAVGTFISKDIYYPHGISNDERDGLLTSGSFTYEATYQFRPRVTGSYSTNQSLVRLQLTGSGVSSSEAKGGHGFAIANLVVHSGSLNSITGSGSTITLFALPSQASSDALLKLSLAGPNIFDGNQWNISFGRIRSDQRLKTDSQKYIVDPISSAGSSSYFLRCARQSNGELKEVFTTSSYFKDSTTLTDNVFQNFWSKDSLKKGSQFIIGSQSMYIGATDENHFLNDESLDSRPRASSGDRVKALETKFEGNISQIRFWSRYLEKDEWKEHVRNFKSVGVLDPRINFNFDTYPTGAFERLRVDTSIDQHITSTDISGKIRLTDFTQNNFLVSGSGFESEKIVIKPQTFYYSHLSPKFDVAQTDNKVRIRSWETAQKIEDSAYAYSAPQYDVVRSEQPDDDTRFSIDFSSVKSLDEDIMNMFGTLEFFDNALGAPNLIFDDSYPDIEQARKIYFQRLTAKPDYQVFFDMYKWFNSSLGMIIEQFIPRKTKFLGINFVIESHVLERNRFRYLFDEIYLLSLQRDTSRGNLFLSQIVGNLKKF